MINSLVNFLGTLFGIIIGSYVTTLILQYRLTRVIDKYVTKKERDKIKETLIKLELLLNKLEKVI